MKRRLVGLLSVALLVPPLAPSAAPHVLVVRCGTLITDAARAPLRDATIIVTDRIITAVGAGLAAKHFASFKLALAAGVTMAAGADDFYQPDRPAGLPSELVTDVKYGMEPQQALVTATTNSAALLGLDALGAIAVGKEGTLIALEGNPLTDITAVQRVRAVVKEGQVVKQPVKAVR